MAKKPLADKSGKTENATDGTTEKVTLQPDADIVSAEENHNEEDRTFEDAEIVEADEVTVEEIVPDVDQPTVVQEEIKSASPVWMILGGLVAGGIGYALAQMNGGYDDSSLQQRLAQQSARIADLQDQLATIPEPVSLDQVTADLAQVGDMLSATNERIDQDFAALSDRVEIVEKQPSADGTLQEAAVAAYERDVAELRGQMATQRAELNALLDQTTAQLEVTRQEAEAIELDAVERARAATARAALAQIQGALESGAPFEAALADLAETLEGEVPTALSSVSAGAPTMASLQEAFPDAARNALAVARSEGVAGEESGGLTSFLKSQFDVRSVTPQEGSSADAMLSRAEAAMRGGRLNDALAEISGLPEVARGALTDWTAQAETRANAVDAALTLVTQIDAN